MKEKNFYIIAGEASGDIYGAELVYAIKERLSESMFFGFGGEKMKNAGVKISRDLSQLEIIGFAEVLFKAKDVIQNFKIARKEIIRSNADALILIDYPGFNLRIAKWAKKRGIKVYYFVAPQTWAWKEKRNEIIKWAVDKLFVILPFEKDYFQQRGINAIYVGHPMVQFLKNNDIPNKDFSFQGDKGLKKVAVLPGSRKGELKRMIPILEKMIIKSQGYYFIVAGMSKNGIQAYENLSDLNNVTVIYDNVERVLRCSDFGIIKSGTSTLQAALLNLPQVVFYKVNRISAFIMRKLAKVKYISLPNLILNKALLTELIQEELTEENLLSAVQKLNEEKFCDNIRLGYNQLKSELMTDIPVFEKAAQEILNDIETR